MTQDEWLEANTFYCERLKARITRKQCEINRNLPGLNEQGKRVNLEHHNYQKRPIACERCDGTGRREKEGKSVGMTQNIIRDTMQAMQKSITIAQVCEALGINEGALRWRMNHCKEIHEIAVQRGIIKARVNKFGHKSEPAKPKPAFKPVLEVEETPHVPVPPAPPEPATIFPAFSQTKLALNRIFRFKRAFEFLSTWVISINISVWRRG